MSIRETEMIRAIARPIESLKLEDVEDLCAQGWPENQNTEFKEALPDRGKDSWSLSATISDFAKERIFKEIVAFANSSGGRLFLGIEESDEKPASATKIREIPNCHDLAERLQRAAYSSIEPPINALKVQAITTNAAGSGVIVFDVPSSHSAPHRSKDLICYIRRGTESVPMTMYEIQDLTLRLSRRIDEINQRFVERQEAFLDWLLEGKQPTNRFVGFRATAIPIGTPLYIERVFNNPEVIRPINPNVVAYLDGDPKRRVGLNVPWFAEGERPIVRGSRREYSDSNQGHYCSVYCDGLIEYGWKRYWSDPGGNQIELNRVLGACANVMVAAEGFNIAAKAPGSSYAIEVDIAAGSSGGSMPIRIFGLTQSRFVGDLKTRLILERLSFGDKNRVLSIINRDVCDGCGFMQTEPPSIVLETIP
jgi:Putative DNA-binding domain